MEPNNRSKINPNKNVKENRASEELRSKQKLLQRMVTNQSQTEIASKQKHKSSNKTKSSSIKSIMSGTRYSLISGILEYLQTTSISLFVFCGTLGCFQFQMIQIPTRYIHILLSLMIFMMAFVEAILHFEERHLFKI